MIDPDRFIKFLISKKISCFYGVPDSLLKPFCRELLDLPKDIHQITTNEANAISSSIGNYLATSKMACAYFQNSGLGNTINPIVSLASKDVYSIPLLLLIGWRGELFPGDNQIKDEPQHIQQGRITLEQLKVLDIPFYVLDENCHDWESHTLKIIEQGYSESRVVALVIRKNTFEDKVKTRIIESSGISKVKQKFSMSREIAIQEIINLLPDNIPIFSTTGMASRELYEFRKNNNILPIDFYTVGGMGCTSSIALGFLRSSKETKQIICIDGDGSILMHMGSLFKVSKQPGFIHLVINNNAHDSVGGQPTDAYDIDFVQLGQSLGFNFCYSVSSKKELKKAILASVHDINSSYFIEIRVYKGNRKNLGRPKETPIQNKNIFMKRWSNK